LLYKIHKKALISIDTSNHPYSQYCFCSFNSWQNVWTRVTLKRFDNSDNFNYNLSNFDNFDNFNSFFKFYKFMARPHLLHFSSFISCLFYRLPRLLRFGPTNHLGPFIHLPWRWAVKDLHFLGWNCNWSYPVLLSWISIKYFP
jgi:hypothetical protein